MLMPLTPFQCCHSGHWQTPAERGVRVGTASARGLGLLTEERRCCEKWPDSQTCLFLLAPFLRVRFRSVLGHVLTPPCWQLPLGTCRQNPVVCDYSAVCLPQVVWCGLAPAVSPPPTSCEHASRECTLPASVYFLWVRPFVSSYLRGRSRPTGPCGSEDTAFLTLEPEPLNKLLSQTFPLSYSPNMNSSFSFLLRYCWSPCGVETCVFPRDTYLEGSLFNDSDVFPHFRGQVPRWQN